MKVFALLTDAFGGHGGIALYNRDILSALCRHKQVAEVIAVARCAEEHPAVYPEKLTYDTSGIKNGFSFIKAVFRIILKNPGFDFILCAHINLMPLAWLVGKILRAPVILEVYGIDAWQPRGKWLAERLCTSASAVISISEYTRVRFLSWSRVSPEKCKILPNAIHAEKYGVGSKPEALIQRYGLEDKKVLLTLGRIVSKERAKGFDEILDVLPELLLSHPALVYLIAGDGEYADALKSKVSALKLNNHVVFTGMVDEAEKADIYRLADVYVMPSRGEGFGFVFLEALACGIPVVASKLDGSREAVLDGQLGAIVDPDKPLEIKLAISEALGKRPKIPEKLEYFSFENFTLRLHNIIDEVISPK
ncbi:MAG TPA: glycosyltransferase family 1 protein [Gammaproteobacteria bacterium]|nr:glycosyltransferase family 1 protein [Gammaproteobacteria bacterium]